jgi:predicted PurR-regulated permease PerM
MDEAQQPAVDSPPAARPAPPPVPVEAGSRFYRKLNMTAMGLLVFVLVVHLLQTFASVLQQLFIAAFLIYAILPAHRTIVRVGVPSILSFLLIAGLLLAASFGLGQMIYASIDSLRANLPQYEGRVNRLVLDVSERLTWLDGNVVRQLVQGNDAGPAATVNMVRTALGTFVGFLSQILIVFVYLIFLLSERISLGRRVEVGFTHHRAEEIMAVAAKINSSIEQYIAVKTWMSVLAGILTTLVLLICGVDYAILWGILAFLLNYIPYLGSVVATVLPVLLGFLQFETIWTPLVVLILLLIVQNGIGYVVEPRLAGTRLDLSPLVIILSLAFWGSLWGIVGMILAVPLVVVMKAILENIEQTRPIAMLLSNR